MVFAFLGSPQNEPFGLKFCAHRWVENVKVVNRAQQMLPKLRTYVTSVPTKPVVSSFDTLEKFLQDQFLESKLEFFKSLAMELEPFLIKFQSPAPMSPYLYDELMQIHSSILRRIVKNTILSAASTAKKLLKISLIDTKSSEFLAPDKIDIGKSPFNKNVNLFISYSYTFIYFRLWSQEVFAQESL